MHYWYSARSQSAVNAPMHVGMLCACMLFPRNFNCYVFCLCLIIWKLLLWLRSKQFFYVLTELCILLGDQRLVTGRCGFPVFHYMNTEHPIKFTDIFGAIAKFDSKLRPTGAYAVAMMWYCWWSWDYFFVCRTTSLDRLLHLPSDACWLSFLSHCQWSRPKSQFFAPHRKAPLSGTDYGHLDSACAPRTLWHYPTPTWPACATSLCPVSCGEFKEIETKGT